MQGTCVFRYHHGISSSALYAAVCFGNRCLGTGGDDSRLSVGWPLLVGRSVLRPQSLSGGYSEHRIIPKMMFMVTKGAKSFFHAVINSSPVPSSRLPITQVME